MGRTNGWRILTASASEQETKLAFATWSDLLGDVLDEVADRLPPPQRRAIERLGAPLWATKARGELARIGGRAPSPTELTPTERRVADLVAQGMTNREVAGTLFMSEHTVRANLKRIYPKLGVRSRIELAARLRD